jgi:peptidyl-prolyl cis-trans isomerase SurA
MISRMGAGLIAISFVLVFAEQEKLDGIAAIIGDEIILRSELDAYTLLRLNGMNINPDSVDTKPYREKFLDELIDGKVLLVHAKHDSTISVKDMEIEQALNNHINSIVRQNNITMEQLETELTKQQGISLAKFKADARKAIREQLLKQKVQQNYIMTSKVNKKDVEDFYKQYKDSLPQAGESVQLSKLSLAVSVSDSVKQAAFDKIRSIKRRLENGESFEELAKKYSESPENVQGGDLGFISKGTLTELAFEEKAFNLAPGQTSEPFETHLGFHIINVIEKQDNKVHIRQIFIKVAPSKQQTDLITFKLDSIRNSCKTESDFISAVKKFSADLPSKARGGRLGWSTLPELSSSVRLAVDTLQTGSVTKPVQEDNMISIYRINDRVKSRVLTPDNDWNILADKTKEIMAQKKLIDLVSRWRKETFIDIRK